MMSLLITAFFTGAWYTMIRDPEVATEKAVAEEKTVPNQEMVFQDGEVFIETDQDDNELFKLQVTKLDALPEDADVEEPSSNQKYAIFELHVENFEDYGKGFKGYYSNLKIGNEKIEPSDFVVVDKKGWNKIRLESGGHVKMVLIYLIDDNTNEMDLLISPEFYYKDIIYRFET